MLFDPEANRWSEAASPPADFDSWSLHSVSLLDGRLLFLDEKTQRAGWLFDESKQSWSATSEIPIPHRGAVFAKRFDDGRVLVLFSDKSPLERWVSMIYDPAHDKWNATGSLPNVMRSTPTTFARLTDGSVMVVGFQQMPYPDTVPLIFNPRSDRWAIAGQFPPGTLNVRGATTLPDGRVITFAENTRDSHLQGLQFNPARTRWSTVQGVPERIKYAAMYGTLKDGSPWAIGYGVSWGEREELVYSVKEDSWRTVGALPNKVVSYSRPSLPDGTVLLFFGPGIGGLSPIDGALRLSPE